MYLQTRSVTFCHFAVESYRFPGLCFLVLLSLSPRSYSVLCVSPAMALFCLFLILISLEVSLVSTSPHFLDKKSFVFCPAFSAEPPLHLVLFFPSHLSYSHFWGGMRHLFLRLSRSLGKREGEHVRACVSADTLQLQGRPG